VLIILLPGRFSLSTDCFAPCIQFDFPTSPSPHGHRICHETKIAEKEKPLQVVVWNLQLEVFLGKRKT
jgi:hypothetical protein